MSTNDANTSLDGRVSILEHSVHQLDRRVEAGFTDLSKTIREIGTKLGDVKQPIPFKEIIITVSIMCGIFAYAGSFLEGQYGKNIAPLEQRVQLLERAMGNGLLLGMLKPKQDC